MSGSGSCSRGSAGVYGIMSEYRIAHARPEDLAHLPLIELAASQLLSGHAPASVLNETTSQDALLKALRDGHLWVVLADGAPVGFARVEMLDVATAHVEEIDVLPSHGRRGLGTRLVTHVCRWAAAGGYTSVTLTTFRDVPWNMPFYERLGFRVVPAEELSPALRARVDDETRRGLDPSRGYSRSRRPARRPIAAPRRPPSRSRAGAPRRGALNQRPAPRGSRSRSTPRSPPTAARAARPIRRPRARRRRSTARSAPAALACTRPRAPRGPRTRQSS